MTVNVSALGEKPLLRLASDLSDARRQPRARPRIVIVGAGFGGLTVARKLAKAPVDITLIDRERTITCFNRCSIRSQQPDYRRQTSLGPFADWSGHRRIRACF